MKSALVTGVTGQDGAYLTQFLLAHDYRVYGAYRRTANQDFWRLKQLKTFEHENLRLIELDITDLSACLRVVNKYEIDEIYNLAAQSHVGTSFDQPLATAAITGLGPVNLLEAIKLTNKSIKFYQASTSELYGSAAEIPQTESTPFYPRSPYAAAKLYAHSMVINYREAYGMFATTGILFNHESPLRGKEFVTRKVTDGIARIIANECETLYLGNLNAKRDWGHAKDYVAGIYKIMQAIEPSDFVLATGRTETVETLVSMACASAGLNIEWITRQDQKVAIAVTSGKPIVVTDPNLYRPSEVDILVGDFSKAKRELNWHPSINLEELVNEMMIADLERYQVGSKQ